MALLTIDDIRGLLELGWPALITLAYVKLWIDYRSLMNTAFTYAERCGPPCPDRHDPVGETT